jgi:hypothetical protein
MSSTGLLGEWIGDFDCGSQTQGFQTEGLLFNRFEDLTRVSFTMEDVNWRSFGVLSSALAVLSMTGAAGAQKAARNQSLPECGPPAGQTLRCPKVGFSYKVPFGWVDRTEDMQESASADPSKAGDQANAEQTGKTLLAVFERPPGTSGSDVNSAVIIALEDRATYPQVKVAADYFGPLSEIAAARGFKMDGDPYSFRVGARQLVRGDFNGGDEKNPIRQTSLVLLEKDYILFFTFLASSDDEIDSLIENLTFTPNARKASPK